ncbi:MAG: hypothetical protein LBU87_02545 [Lactobacillales bacterium]|nr:hypothetical protein [Lactobacillales bacterium]
MWELADIFKCYGDIGQEAIIAVQKAGKTGGSDFELLLYSFGKSGVNGTGDGDILEGTEENDIIYANTGNDIVYGRGGDDILCGDEGTDFLYGGTGDDRLEGGVGVDHLYGEEGNDTLIGGAGNDRLYGGLGNDVYHFGFMGDYDVIVETNAGGYDIIELAPEVRASDVSFSREGYSLLITLSDGSELAVTNWAYNSAENGYDYGNLRNTLDYSGSFIELIRFANGVDANINLKDLIEQIPVYGSIYADNLYLGDLNDTVYGGAGNDVIYGYGGNDRLFGEEGNDSLYGGAGNDFMNGGDGDDFLDGGAGIDDIMGGFGNDIYRFGFGYDQDGIREFGGTDVIELAADVMAQDVTISKEGNNMKITLSDGSSVTIQYGWHLNYPDRWVEKIRFLNGVDADINLVDLIAGHQTGTDGDDRLMGTDQTNDTLYGKAGNDALYGYGGNDVLYGGDGNDVLDGGAGDDTLIGGMGDDVYRFGFGCGHDTITDAGGYDRVEFAPDVYPSDVVLYRLGNDIRIMLSDGSSLTIKDGIKTPTMVESIFFTNYSAPTMYLSEIIRTLPTGIIPAGQPGTPYNDILNGSAGDDILNGGAGNDTLMGGAGNDVYRFDAGSGHDIITGEKGGFDVIEMGGGITPDQLSIHKDMNDLLIYIGGSSSLRIHNGLLVDSDYFIEKIRFENGGVEINLADMILGAPVYLTAGDDSVELRFDFDKTVYAGSGDDYVCDAMGTNNRFFGEAGDDCLMGNVGSDYLDGGTGNDILSGGHGNDTYVFGAGYDQDLIYDLGGQDVLDIRDYAYDDLWFTRDGDHLKISANGTMDQVTVNNWFKNNDCKIETIETVDHTLDDVAVARLVQAMAGFNPPAGSIADDADLAAQLTDTLHNTWHAKAA